MTLFKVNNGASLQITNAPRYENSIYIVAGAAQYDIPSADLGRGHLYLYKWDLVVSGS